MKKVSTVTSLSKEQNLLPKKYFQYVFPSLKVSVFTGDVKDLPTFPLLTHFGAPVPSEQLNQFTSS